MNAKRKGTRTTNTALAAIALLAALGIASNSASAQSYNYHNPQNQNGFMNSFMNAINNLKENAPTDAECLTAWESSWAYGQCGARSLYTLVEETVEAVGFVCSVETHCEHWSENTSANEQRGGGPTPISRRATWEGDVDVLPNIQNCNGELKRVC